MGGKYSTLINQGYRIAVHAWLHVRLSIIISICSLSDKTYRLSMNILIEEFKSIFNQYTQWWFKYPFAYFESPFASLLIIIFVRRTVCLNNVYVCERSRKACFYPNALVFTYELTAVSLFNQNNVQSFESRLCIRYCSHRDRR